MQAVAVPLGVQLCQDDGMVGRLAHWIPSNINNINNGDTMGKFSFCLPNHALLDTQTYL